MVDIMEAPLCTHDLSHPFIDATVARYNVTGTMNFLRELDISCFNTGSFIFRVHYVNCFGIRSNLEQLKRLFKKASV